MIKEAWKLEDLCLRITDGAHHSPKSQESGFPMASVKDMTEYGIKFSDCRKISEDDFIQLKRNDCRPHINDILIAKDGSYLKNVFVNKQDIDFVILSSIAILRPNLDRVNPFYLAYLLSTPQVKGAMANYVSGTALPRIILKEFRKFEVKLPQKSEQDRIADIIKSYNDLIENNTRRIELLEESARLLYREWFVHLRFPGHEHTKVTKGVPEGWSNESIEDKFEVRNGFAFKSKDYSSEGVPIIRTRDFSSTKFIDRSEGINLPEDLVDKYNKYLLKKWDFLLIMVGASLGKYGIVMEKDLPCLQNQNMWAIYTRNENEIPQIYVLGFMEEIINTVMNYRVGAARDFFRKDFVRKQKIKIPPKPILLSYRELVEPIFEQISNLLTTIEKLKQSRDILLPRLMSGDIAV